MGGNCSVSNLTSKKECDQQSSQMLVGKGPTPQKMPLVEAARLPSTIAPTTECILPTRASVLAHLAARAGAKFFWMGWKARRVADGSVRAEVRRARDKPLCRRYDGQQLPLDSN